MAAPAPAPTPRDVSLMPLRVSSAFASQAVMSIEHIGLDYKKVNPNGGAIALGVRFLSLLNDQLCRQWLTTNHTSSPNSTRSAALYVPFRALSPCAAVPGANMLAFVKQGARQIATALAEAKRSRARIICTSMCIGSGMGAASLIVAEN